MKVQQIKTIHQKLKEYLLKKKRIRHLKFSQTQGQEFSQTLKKRVNLYFKLNKIQRGANAIMVVKTIIMLLIYSVPLLLLSSGFAHSPFSVIILYLISGLGIAGIGMDIMHDANHGAYSKNSFIGKLLGHSLDLMGCSSEIWKLQHNVLHHTYTNIDGHDEDIGSPVFLLRFSPHGKKYKIHKYQHYYVWFFYSILTLFWITGKDFKKAREYYKKGLIKTKKEYRIRLLKLIPLKLMYFTYALIIPLMVSSVSPGWIFTGFIAQHLVAGIMLSVVFQLAHVVPGTEFPQPDTNKQINENWYIHQLKTTSNFSPKNKWLSWYFGGLTNQIEHHLFPNICHVHYKNLSKIVKQTAYEYQLPYYENKTLYAAISGHIKTLQSLGKH